MICTDSRSLLRAFLATLVACVAVGACAVGGAGPAFAQDYPPDAEGVQLDRDSVRPGQTVLVVSDDWCPRSLVDVWLVSRGSSDGARSSRRSRRRITRVRASSAGRVRKRVRIPRRTRPGRYALELTGRATDCNSARRVSAPLDVEGNQDEGENDDPPGEDGASPDGDGGGGGDSPSSGGGFGGDSDEGGSSDGSLPFTGLQLSLLLAVGVALLAAGVVMRRRTSSS